MYFYSDLKMLVLKVFYRAGQNLSWLLFSIISTQAIPVVSGAFFCLLSYDSFAVLPNAILIRSTNTPAKEFSAYAETEPVKTYIQHRLEKIKKTPRPLDLRALLKQAQMDFLSHEPSYSKKSFQAIVEHIHAFDWNKEERKIIFYSLFRLAQLEKDLKRQTLLLKEALAFSMDLKVDKSLFPPPVTNRYAQIKQSATFVSVDLKKIFPLHSVVIINGRVYSHQESLILPYGFYRVSALSTSHKPWTKVLSLSRLVVAKPNTKALAGGSCQNPILRDKSLKGHSLLILFPNFCVWSSAVQLAKEQKKDLLPLKAQMAEDLKEPEKNTEHWEEWLWLGVAVVAGATTLWALTRGESKEQPSSRKPPEKKPEPKVKIGF